MMQYLSSIEDTVAGWYKNFPQPPRVFKRWLVDNVWWVIVINVFLGTLGLLATVKDASMSGINFSLTLPGIFSTMDQAAASITFLIALVVVILNAVAISPLRNKYKIGWKLLFAALILSVLSLAIGVVLTFDVGAFISGAISSVIVGYLLFSFRDQYVVHSIKSSSKKSSRK